MFKSWLRRGDCPEYTELIRFLRSEDEFKDTDPDLPLRAHAAIVTEMGVEDTSRGPLLLVGGNRLFIPCSARRRMLDLLHSTPLRDRSMMETDRKLRYWGGMNKNPAVLQVL